MEQEYEPEIDIKDFLFFILYKWRMLLLSGIFFCVLFSGYKIIQKFSDSYEEQKPKKIREYELELAEYNLNQISYQQNMQIYEDWLAQQELYMEKSVLMHTDPYHKPVAAVDIFVRLDNAEWDILPDNVSLDPTDSLIKMYTSYFHSNLNWKPIEELTGLEELYLRELVGINTDYNSNSFTVAVTYSNGNTAAEIRDIIVNQIMNRYQEMALGVSAHTLMVSNQSLSYTIDEGLAASQKGNADTITGYEHTILGYEKKLDELIELEPKKPFVFGFAKYPVLGFVGGGFIAGIVYAMCYLLGGKLRSAGDLKSRYGYILLGVIPPIPSTGFFSIIDTFIRKVEGIKYPSSKDEMFSRIAVNIRNLADGKQKLILTGSIEGSKLQEVKASIAPYLKDMDLLTAADINSKTDALKMLSKCDAVILIEERNVSLISSIRKEHESISILKKQVVGYILL